MLCSLCWCCWASSQRETNRIGSRNATDADAIGSHPRKRQTVETQGRIAFPVIYTPTFNRWICRTITLLVSFNRFLLWNLFCLHFCFILQKSREINCPTITFTISTSFWSQTAHWYKSIAMPSSAYRFSSSWIFHLIKSRSFIRAHFIRW